MNNRATSVGDPSGLQGRDLTFDQIIAAAKAVKLPTIMLEQVAALKGTNFKRVPGGSSYTENIRGRDLIELNTIEYDRSLKGKDNTGPIGSVYNEVFSNFYGRVMPKMKDPWMRRLVKEAAKETYPDLSAKRADEFLDEAMSEMADFNANKLMLVDRKGNEPKIGEGEYGTAQHWRLEADGKPGRFGRNATDKANAQKVAPLYIRDLTLWIMQHGDKKPGFLPVGVAQPGGLREIAIAQIINDQMLKQVLRDNWNRTWNPPAPNPGPKIGMTLNVWNLWNPRSIAKELRTFPFFGYGN